MTLKEFIQSELNMSFHIVKTKKTIMNILEGTKSYQAFYNRKCCSMTLNDPLLPDQFCADIYDACLEYSSSKESIVNIFVELTRRLKNKYHIIVELNVPSFTYTNDVERQLFLIRFFHPSKNHTIQDACQVLWMYNQERIDEDIKEIKKGSLSFLGKDIKINIDRRCGAVVMQSTAHPLILVENLTQILVQLEGLRLMAHGETKYYALHTAQTIWSQLSDYAKERIVFVVKNLYEKDPQFYYDLNQSEELFFDEKSCSNIEGLSGILHFLKNEKSFFLAYYDQEELKKIYCRIHKWDSFERIIIEDLETNDILTLEADTIVCSAETKEEFIHYLN